MHFQVLKGFLSAIFIHAVARSNGLVDSLSCVGDLRKDYVCKDQADATCETPFVPINNDHDCEKEFRCVCPDENTLRFNYQCYQHFQCPKKSADAPSNNRSGHNFVVPGLVNSRNQVYGMHISGLKLPPHWYHGIIKFEITDPICAQKVREGHAKDPNNFMNIIYRVPTKLVDLLTVGNQFMSTIAHGAGQSVKPFVQCNVQVKQVLDLRRYNTLQPYPSCQQFFLFGDGRSAYLSHMPTRCKDTQQIIWLKSKPCGISAKQLRAGMVVWLPELEGHPVKDANGRIIDPLTKSSYEALYDCDYEEEDDSYQDEAADDIVEQDQYDAPAKYGHCSHIKRCRSTTLKIKKKYPVDTFIVNLLCP